jgi:hypothetical protein
MRRHITCATCCRSFAADHWLQKYCSQRCAVAKAPVVYRYICPDGRSYVGAVANEQYRFQNGIQRNNPLLREAFTQYPSETWTYEILERLRPGCSEDELRVAENHHINRLRTLDPKYGFNIYPAQSATSRTRRLSNPRRRVWYGG